MANRYWVGGTGTWNTTSTTNWSASDGGASGASVPTSADSVFFTDSSGLTGASVITLSGNINCLGFNFTASANCSFTATSFALGCNASFTLTNASVNFSAIGTINSTGSLVRGFNSACNISNVTVGFVTGGSVTLQSNINCNAVVFNVPVDFAGFFISSIGQATISSVPTSIDLRSGTTVVNVTYNFTSGSIRTNGFTLSSGTFVYGSTASLLALDGINFLPSFTHTAGNFTLNKNLALSSTSTYTLTLGTLTLGANLTVGIFSSNNTNIRSIAFGIYNITLNHTTAAQTVLNVPNGTNFTWTGTGRFITDASVTRTIAVGSGSSGSILGFNVTYTGTGNQTQTLTNSDFNTLDFGTTTCSVTAGQITVANLIFSASGTYTGVVVRLTDQHDGAGVKTFITNGKTVSSLQVIGTATTTFTFTGSLGTSTYTQTSGNVDFAGFNLTCSSTVSYTAGTLSNIGTITCTTWTITGTFNFTNGTITPSTSFVLTSGAFNYSGGTLSAVPTFTHTAGTVTLGNSYALTSSGTYTFSSGNLNLGNYTLTTGSFSSGGGTARTVDFSTSSLIQLTGNNATIWEGGSGGFTITGTMQVVSTYSGSTGTRTVNVGTGWTQATDFDVKCNACVGIQINSGATDTVVIAGVVKDLDLTGLTCTFSPGVMTVYGDYTIPASGGTVSATANLTTFASTNATSRTITISRSIDFPITFSGVGGTFQLGAALTNGTTRTVTLLNGTFNLNNYNLTTGLFVSNNSNTRTLDFGSGSITVNGIGTPWDTTITTGLTVTGSKTVNVTTAGVSTITVIPGVITESNAFDFNITGTTTINFLTVGSHATRNVDFTGFTGTLAATAAVTIYGNYTLSAGMTVTASASTMTFGATSGTKTITTNGKTMPPVIINGVGGTFNLGSSLTSSGSLQVLAGTFDTTASNFNITCTAIDSATTSSVRAISLNGSTVTVSGTAGVTLNDVNLTFSCGTSQLTLSNATSTVLSVIGSETFRDVSFTGGAPLVTLVGTNTYNNLTFTNGASAAPSVVTITGNQTVGGTLSNSSTNAYTRLRLQSSTSGSQIILSAGTESLTDVDFKDIDAAGAAIPFVGTRFGDLGNNTDITFDAARTLYWNLVAGGNWNATAWATTSGGTPDINNFPLAQDTCIIENTGLNTSATITMNANWTFGTLNMSTRTNAMTLAIGTTTPTVTGNWTNGTGTTLTGTGTVNFKNTGTTQTITASGITFTPNISYESVGGTLQLATALTLGATSTFTLTKGTLSLNGFTLTTGIFSSNNSFTRSIAFGTTNIILAHTTAGTNVLDMASLSNFSTSGTGQFTSAMGVTRTFTSGTLGSVTGSLAFNGTTQFASISYGQGGTMWTGTLALPDTFTIESWVYLTSTPSTGATIVALWGTSSAGGKNWSLGVNSSLQLVGDYASNRSFSGGSIPLNTWTHVAWVGTGTNQLLFVNGVQVASAGQVANFGNLSTSPVYIGARADNATSPNEWYFPGNISNLRVVNGVQVYTGTFTPPVSPLTATQSSGTNISAITGTATKLLLNTPNNASNLTDTSVDNFTLTSTGTASALTPITVLPAAGTPPSLALTSGAAVPTFTTGSYFTNLDFTGTTSTPAASLITINGNLTLATGGTYTSLGVTMAGTGTITPLAKTIAAFTVNTTGTVTLAAAFGCTTFTMTAGTLNLASFNLTCSSTATYTAGTLSNIATITCTTWTTQGTFAHSQGTITPSTSFVITSGSYTQTGTSVLSAVPTFTQTAGDVTFRSTYALTATGTYTLTAGALTLGGNLTTGIFTSTNTNTRSIAFSTFNIVLAHTTAAQTVLGMATLTNFTWTGTGGFTSAMSVTRTFQSGSTAGASSTTVPNLSLISGASIPTITSGSSFNNLNFTGSTSSPASTNISVYGNLTLASGGSYTTFTVNMVGSAGNINGAGTSSLLGLVINNGGGTTTLTAALTLTATGTTTLTSGNLNLGGFTLTTGTFVSSGTTARSITFGTSNIILATTALAAVNLDMADATNFTYTSSGTYGSGTGCFQSTMSTTRTFRFGSSAGGSATNAPRLYLASGASIATLTTGSWFGEIDFGTTGYTTAATNLNLVSLKSNLSTSVLTLLTATMVGSGSIRTNTTIGPLVINTSGITTTLAGTTLCTTTTLTLGTLDLASQILTCSSTFTWNGGSLLNFGTLSCTTFTLNGPTLNLTAGTLNPSTSFVLNTGSFSYSAPATLGATTTFTQNAGTVTFNKTYALNAVSTYTLAAGSLTIADGVTLSTGIFSSNVTATRSIAFGSTTAGNINLTHTTAATVVLSMADLTNFSYTGPGGFTVADMGNTRTFTYGSSANGSATTAVNLTFTTGASAIALTNGSWFKTLNYGTTTSTSTGTSISVVGSLLLNGTYTAMTISMLGTGNLNGGASASLLTLTINTIGTITMTGNLTMLGTGTVNLTQGSLVLNGFTLTTGRFLSDGTGFTRSVDFGSTNIVLAHTTAGTTVLAMANVTGFTWTGTTGGFSTSMGVTRTLQYGSTAGGSTSTAVNLLINGGAAVPTLTTGSWFKNLDFTGSTNVPAVTTLNITGNLTLATGGTYTSLSATMLDTSTITPNGKTIAAFVVNTPNTITLAGALGCTTYTQTAGTMNFATFNLACSSTATYTGGTLSNIGTLTCTTFTLNGPSYTFSSGTITPSTSFVITSGSFTYDSPAVLSAVPTFTHSAGDVTLNQAYSLTATGTYRLVSGNLNLGANLTTGIFNTNSQLFRSIAFSTFNIVLAHTTAAQTVLNMPDIVNFSYTGTGTFTTAMSVTRTFTSGTQMGIPGSILYSGSQSSLAATNAGFAYGTNIDFTWEAWVYTSVSATGGVIFNNQVNSNDTSGVSVFVVGGQAYWYNLGLNAGNGGTFGTTAANSIPDNTWTHVVFQRRGTDFEIYINGTLASSYTPVSPINMGASSQPFYIGRSQSGIFYTGRITNIRVVKSTAVYTGNFTSPTIPLAAAQVSDTNISALSGAATSTILMLNAARGAPFTESSLNGIGFSNSAVPPVTNTSSPFPDAYYGQYPNLNLTSGASVPTFTTSSLFNTLDFTGCTGAPSGSVSINSITLDTGPVYTGLSVICVGTGSIVQNNKTLSTFEVKNGYVGGTVTIATNPLAAANYTQTSGTIDFSSLTLTLSGTYTYVSGTQLNMSTITCATLAVNGTYNFSSGTVTPSTSVVVTSPGAFTYSGTATLGSVPTFTHTSGSVTLSKNYALTATGTYTLTAGSLTLGDGLTLTTGIFSSTNTNTRSIAFGDITPANIILAHTTAATTVLSMADLTNFSWTGTGGFTSAMSVTRTFQSGSTAGGSVTTAPNLSLTSGASIPTIASNSWIENLDFTGSTCTPAGTTLNIAGNLTLASGGTYTNININAVGTGTITPNGKVIQAFVVNNGAGTTTLASALSCTTYTQTSGTIDFGTFNLTCSSTGLFTAGTLSNIGTLTCTTFTVSGTFAHTDGTITPSVSFVTTSGSYTQTGTSVLSAVPAFTQTAGNVTFRSTYALTATGTYTLTAGTLTLGGNLTTGIFSSTGTGTRAVAFGSYNIVLAHTTAATTVLSMADITNFTPTGAGGFAADASITRTFTVGTTAGGSTTTAPNLSLTGSGTAVATLTTSSWFNILDFGTTAFTVATTSLNVDGLTLSSSGTYTNLTVTARGSGTFTSNGKTLSTFTINALSDTAILADAMTVATDILLISGTLNIQSFVLTSSSLTSTGTSTRSITGTGTYELTGSGSTVFSNTSATGITITGIIISMTSASAKTFAGGGGSYSTLNQGGSGALTISGDNSFANITATTKPSTIIFTAGSTQTFIAFTLSGAPSNLVTIRSSSTGSGYNLSRASGTTDIDYLSIEDSNATGGANWYAGVNSINVGNNFGWIFAAAPVGATGNFFLFF